MSRAKPEFKYKAVQSPQAPEDEGIPAAKSGLFRFLGAYLNVRSELDALSLVRYEQSHAARVRAVNNMSCYELGKSVYRDTKALFSV